MTIVRVGATQKYAQGWEMAFAKGKKKPAAAAAGAKKPAAKSSAKKRPAAKKGKRK